MSSLEDMVFIESGPSMQLISSSSVDSLQGTKTPVLNDFSFSPPPATTPSLSCNPCRLAFRPKSGYAPYPPVPESSLEHCCHGSCRRNDIPENKNGTRKPYAQMDFPPPPFNTASTSWVATNINGVPRKMTPPSYNVSCQSGFSSQD